jgi:hypothetical protein
MLQINNQTPPFLIFRASVRSTGMPVKTNASIRPIISWQMSTVAHHVHQLLSVTRWRERPHSHSLIAVAQKGNRHPELIQSATLQESRMSSIDLLQIKPGK